MKLTDYTTSRFPQNRFGAVHFFNDDPARERTLQKLLESGQADWLPRYDDRRASAIATGLHRGILDRLRWLEELVYQSVKHWGHWQGQNELAETRAPLGLMRLMRSVTEVLANHPDDPPEGIVSREFFPEAQWPKAAVLHPVNYLWEAFLDQLLPTREDGATVISLLEQLGVSNQAMQQIIDSAHTVLLKIEQGIDSWEAKHSTRPSVDFHLLKEVAHPQLVWSEQPNSQFRMIIPLLVPQGPGLTGLSILKCLDNLASRKTGLQQFRRRPKRVTSEEIVQTLTGGRYKTDTEKNLLVSLKENGMIRQVSGDWTAERDLRCWELTDAGRALLIHSPDLSTSGVISPEALSHFWDAERQMLDNLLATQIQTVNDMKTGLQRRQDDLARLGAKRDAWQRQAAQQESNHPDQQPLAHTAASSLKKLYNLRQSQLSLAEYYLRIAQMRLQQLVWSTSQTRTTLQETVTRLALQGKTQVFEDLIHQIDPSLQTSQGPASKPARPQTHSEKMMETVMRSVQEAVSLQEWLKQVSEAFPFYFSMDGSQKLASHQPEYEASNIESHHPFLSAIQNPIDPLSPSPIQPTQLPDREESILDKLLEKGNGNPPVKSTRQGDSTK